MGANELLTYSVAFLGILLVAYQVVTIRFSLIRIEHKLNLVLARLGLDPLAPTPLSDRVKALVREGRRIEAIRALRAESGLGFAEARAAIDAHRASGDDEAAE
jgi:hypothetical protein